MRIKGRHEDIPICIVRRSHSMTISMRLPLRHHVLGNNVCCEGDEGDTEPRKSSGEHGTTGEDRMLAPGLAFCPGVAEELRVLWCRHLAGQ